MTMSISSRLAVFSVTWKMNMIRKTQCLFCHTKPLLGCWFSDSFPLLIRIHCRCLVFFFLFYLLWSFSCQQCRCNKANVEKQDLSRKLATDCRKAGIKGGSDWVHLWCCLDHKILRFKLQHLLLCVSQPKTLGERVTVKKEHIWIFGSERVSVVQNQW